MAIRYQHERLYKGIGKNMRKMRGSRSITEMSEKTGVGETALIMMEEGVRAIHIHEFMSIMNAYGQKDESAITKVIKDECFSIDPKTNDCWKVTFLGKETKAIYMNVELGALRKDVGAEAYIQAIKSTVQFVTIGEDDV